MTLTETEQKSAAGAFWALIAVFMFSLNDVIVKYLSGDFPLYQLIFVRSSAGLLFIVTVIVPLTGTLAMLRTRRLFMHLLRGGCVVIANLCFFTSLAVLPLADAVAIFFISPLLISVFSVIFLGETVGPRRWAAILIGMVGVLIVVRPGTTAFQGAALLPLAAACGYAMLHILTRRIGGTENATAMAFYIQCTFFGVASSAGLLFGNGQFDTWDHPSLTFLFTAWVWPEPQDFMLMVALGITSSIGGYTISEAYRRSEAALVAPIEYAALPLAVVWGLTLFSELPDVPTWAGIGLILTSGLFFIWREAAARARSRSARPH